jgi:hypothetical protein
MILFIVYKNIRKLLFSDAAIELVSVRFRGTEGTVYAIQ